MFDGSFGFGGEESAGASFLRFDGTPWSTDKDGIIMCLLAAEITAVTGKNPQEHYNELAARFGAPSYNRLQASATSAQKAALSKLSPEMVSASTLAGDPITARLTAAPGNGASIGGLKVMTDNAGSPRVHPVRKTLTRSIAKASWGKSIASRLRKKPLKSLAKY